MNAEFLQLAALYREDERTSRTRPQDSSAAPPRNTAYKFGTWVRRFLLRRNGGYQRLQQPEDPRDCP
jgi:hypothetical protein